MMEVRPAGARELEVWDDLVVRPGGGHVYQSMAWARHRAASGWRPQHLVAADGSAVLALERSWPLIGGGSAYLPRGPIPAGDAAAMAARLGAFSAWLADHGVDVLATDAEVPAASGYGELIRAAGFGPIEEIQPSRHRLTLALGHGADEASVLAGVAKTTRQRIRAAERAGTIVAAETLGFPLFTICSSCAMAFSYSASARFIVSSTVSTVGTSAALPVVFAVTVTGAVLSGVAMEYTASVVSNSAAARPSQWRLFFLSINSLLSLEHKTRRSPAVLTLRVGLMSFELGSKATYSFDEGNRNAQSHENSLRLETRQ